MARMKNLKLGATATAGDSCLLFWVSLGVSFGQFGSHFVPGSRACRWQSATWSSFGISLQSRRLSRLLLFGHAVLGVQNHVFSSVFGSCVLKICVLQVSRGGGGCPGRAGSASPASSGFSCCHECLFLQILVAFCCFKRS